MIELLNTQELIVHMLDHQRKVGINFRNWNNILNEACS